ncbi:MAG: zinc ribbon domain-containing protein [Thermoplasmata archaeon]|nr:zinc ribbon domain-containing protein [Thermoplasmata archaeon]
MQGRIYCQQCGSPNSGQARYCGRCGHPFASELPAQPALLPPPPPPPYLPPPPPPAAVSPMSGMAEPSAGADIPRPTRPPDPLESTVLPVPPPGGRAPPTSSWPPSWAPPPPPPSPIQFTGDMYHPSHRRIHLVHPADHTTRNVAIVIVVGALILLLLVSVPVPTPFSATFSTGPGGSSGPAFTHSFAKTTVTGTWRTATGVTVNLQVVSADGTLVFSGRGTTGAFSFPADGGAYVFSATSPFPDALVSVQGTSSQSIWQDVFGV